MPPKIGGMGYTLEVMPYIDHLTDVTIVYKSEKREFWNFLCGDMREASVTINTYKIPSVFIAYVDGEENGEKTKFSWKSSFPNRVDIVGRLESIEKYHINEDPDPGPESHCLLHP